MDKITVNQTDFSAQSLALTFLFAGLAYGLPLLLFPANHPMNGPISSEILNLYTLTAWMGLAHFAFAYHGQGIALQRKGKKYLPYLIALFIGGISLYLFRSWFNVQLFSLLVWIYFIPHFIKAELHFSSALEHIPASSLKVTYWFPTLTFAYFSWVLFFPSDAWLRLGLALLLVLIFTMMAGFRHLQNRHLSQVLVLGFFFIGEGLVWGTYRKYMDPHFQIGLYIFHVAMASFYHYFRSYDYALKRQQKASYLVGIMVVNLLIIVLGYIGLRSTIPLINWVLDAQFFTFWVGLHLVMSDYFSWQGSPKI